MKKLASTLATATIAALLTAAPAQAADPRPPSRPGGVVVLGGADPGEVGLGWSASARSGSHPIRRYVVAWVGGRLVLPARDDFLEARIGDLESGRYVFRVKAVSRAGSSRWARSQVAYVD